MFSIQLFSLHVEISIQKKKSNQQKVAQWIKAREIEQELETNRLKYNSQLRWF